MKIYIRKHGILLLTIFSNLVLSFAQNFEETINYADNQYTLANYQLAVKEYQRALYFAKGEKGDYLYRQIANAFFKNNQYGQANYFYDLSYNSTKNDSLKKEIVFSKSQCFLLSGDFKRAVYELFSLGDSLSNYFINKRDFYLGVIYFGLEEFNKSEEYFLCIVNKDSASYHEIKKLFSLRKNLYRPNPKTAKTLSIILPGSGQIYAGDFKNGLNSIMLTGGLAVLGVIMYNQYSLLDAFLGIFPWFLRYYQGGYENSKKTAHNKRAIRRDNTYKKVLEIISESKKIE